MKKTIYLLLLASLMLACSNTNEKATVATNDNTVTTDGNTVATADSIVFSFEDEKTVCSIKTDVPAPTLALSVGEWLDEQLGGYYTGDARDTQALIDFYGRAWNDTLRAAAEEYNNGVPMEYEATVTKDYETDKVVTYVMNTYLGLGGAHPTSRCVGVTFRKSDGRRLGWEIVRGYFSYYLSDMIRTRLMTYFGASTEEELEQMMPDTSIYSIPLPQTPPFFTEEGVMFIYQQYEIAAYAMGMPSDVIPYAELKPYLTSWAQALLP